MATYGQTTGTHRSTPPWWETGTAALVEVHPADPRDAGLEPTRLAQPDGDRYPTAHRRLARRRRSRIRGIVPLLWAMLLTVAALQHAREVDRRTSLSEPTALQFEMRARQGKGVSVAWRAVGGLAQDTPPVTESLQRVAESLPKPVTERWQKDVSTTSENEPRMPDPQTPVVRETAKADRVPERTTVRIKTDPVSAETSSPLQRMTKVAARSDDGAYAEVRSEAATAVAGPSLETPDSAREKSARHSEEATGQLVRSSPPEAAEQAKAEPNSDADEAPDAAANANSGSGRVRQTAAVKPTHHRAQRMYARRASRRSASSSTAFYAPPPPLDGRSARYFTIERPGRLSP